MYDVEQLIEPAKIDLKGKESDDATGPTMNDIIKDLHVRCISNTSKKIMSLLMFSFYFIILSTTNIGCTISGLRQ